MLKTFSLAAAAAVTAMVAMPAAAEAQPRGKAHGYWNNSAHARGYYDDRYDRRDRYYRGDRYERGYDRRYDDRYSRRGYGERHYDERRYSRRCSGTTGTIIGGVAGALLGREVTRDRYRGRSGTTGAILGGAAGALAGRAIDKSGCRR